MLANFDGVVENVATTEDAMRGMDGGTGGDQGVAANLDAVTRVVLCLGRITGQAAEVAAQADVCLDDNTAGKNYVRRAFDLGPARDLVAGVLSRGHIISRPRYIGFTSGPFTNRLNVFSSGRASDSRSPGHGCTNAKAGL